MRLPKVTKKTEAIVFLDGKFLPEEKAMVSALNPGLLYGWGLFETMRSYRNTIVYPNEHLKRLQASAKIIGLKIPYSTPELKKVIRKTISLNRISDAYVRLTVWKREAGVDTAVIVRKYIPFSLQKYKQGFRLCISDLRQNESSILARLKTTNYLLFQLSYKSAKKNGFDDALILNSRGYITEASRSNLFIVKNSALYTPALAAGCLAGITRKVVFSLAKKIHLPVYEAKLTLSDLYAADEAFLTNSLMGIMPCSQLGDTPVGEKPNRITQIFMQRYSRLLHGN